MSKQQINQQQLVHNGRPPLSKAQVKAITEARIAREVARINGSIDHSDEEAETTRKKKKRQDSVLKQVWRNPAGKVVLTLGCLWGLAFVSRFAFRTVGKSITAYKEMRSAIRS